MRGATPTTFSGRKLRALREQKGLSIGQLGKLVNVPSDVLKNYEFGKVQPTWGRAEQMAKSLGGSTIDLLDEEAADNQLIWLRESKLLTQKDVAEHLEVAVSTISRWEAAGQSPEKYATSLGRLYDVPKERLCQEDTTVIRLSIASLSVEAMDDQRGPQSRSQYVTDLIEGDGQ